MEYSILCSMVIPLLLSNLLRTGHALQSYLPTRSYHIWKKPLVFWFEITQQALEQIPLKEIVFDYLYYCSKLDVDDVQDTILFLIQLKKRAFKYGVQRPCMPCIYSKCTVGWATTVYGDYYYSYPCHTSFSGLLVLDALTQWLSLYLNFKESTLQNSYFMQWLLFHVNQIIIWKNVLCRRVFVI